VCEKDETVALGAGISGDTTASIETVVNIGFCYNLIIKVLQLVIISQHILTLLFKVKSEGVNIDEATQSLIIDFSGSTGSGKQIIVE
jgi:pantothenate kinase-related protein Tda10